MRGLSVRLTAELRKSETFYSLGEAQTLIEQWRATIIPSVHTAR